MAKAATVRPAAAAGAGAAEPAAEPNHRAAHSHMAKAAAMRPAAAAGAGAAEPAAANHPAAADAIGAATPPRRASSTADVEAGSASGGAHGAKALSLLPLIALIFFDVSGGPFGTEDAVAAAGPLPVVLGFLLLPLLWSVPEALITAELATAFPENSGYVAWVTAAFGPFWGFQEGFWSWLSGVTDNSVYPVLIAANLQVFLPALASGWIRTAFLVSTSLSLSYLNYRRVASPRLPPAGVAGMAAAVAAPPTRRGRGGAGRPPTAAPACCLSSGVCTQAPRLSSLRSSPLKQPMLNRRAAA